MMFGAYVPRLLSGLLPEIGNDDAYRCIELNGVVLFVDIVDSTSMVNRFAAAGPDGAERLGALLNAYFGRVFGVIEAHGGDVVRLYGDAVLAFWPADDADLAAAAQCASSAATALGDLERASSQDGMTLHHRAIISGGRMSLMLLRNCDEQSFFLLAGPPIDALSAAAPGAQSARALVTDALRRRMHTQPPSRSPAGTAEERPSSAGTPPLRPAAIDERNPARTRKFVQRIVAYRIANADAAWPAEFRVVSIVYVRLDALESAPIERIDDAVGAIQQTLSPLGIALFDLVVDDKGLIAQIACGVPPDAQERNAVRAVEAARQIHRRMKAAGISCSIGITSGRVFCGEVGNQTRRECLIIGTAMHAGARLMQAAQRGILCDAATAHAASDHFDFPLPELLALKGIAEPARVYRAESLEPKQRGIPDAANSLHGRSEEVRRVASALEALDRGRGGMIVIEAEPGAGKSRLLAHIHAEARARTMSVAGSAASSVELTTAYYGCRALVRQLLLEPDDSKLADAEVLRRRLFDAVRGNALESKAALIEDILPLAIADKGLAAEIAGPARLAGLEDLLVLLAGRRCAAAPLVVLVDDVHWLDDPSARILLALRRRVPSLLIAAATRPLDDRASPNVRRLVESATLTLPLARLDRGAVVGMLRELLGARSIPPDLGNFIHAQAEGLAFHTEQLALSLVDRGIVRVFEERCRADMSQLSARAVPDNLRDLIVSRIDSLGPLHQTTAKIASAIGRTFRLDILRHVFPFPAEVPRLGDILSDLARAGILESSDPADAATRTFRHVLIKEATYELLTFEQRQLLHRRVGEFIEDRFRIDLEPYHAELADHFERAADFRRAIRYRHEAARLSIRRYANHDALQHLDRIVSLCARGEISMTDSQAAEQAGMRADALHELTRFNEAQEHFRRCAASSGIVVPETRRALMTDAMVELLRQIAHRCGVIRVSNPAADAGQKDRLTAHIYTRLAEHAYFVGDALWLVHGTMTSLNRAERVGAVAEIVEGYGGLAIGLGTAGLHRLARFYRDRSVRRAELEGTLHDQGFAHLLACVYSFQSGDWSATQAHCGKGAAICQRIGDRFRYQSCRVIEGYMHVLRGCYASAEETLKALGEDADEVENIPVRAWVLAGRAIIDSIRGRSPQVALARLASARDDSLNHADRLLCDGLEALARFASGDIDRAAHIASMALRNITEHPPTMGCAYLSVAAVVEIHIVLAERAKLTGASADAQLASARAACRASSRYAYKTPIYVPRSLLLSGRLALLQGRSRRARTLWRRALSQARARSMPLEEALALLALAQVARHPDERRHGYRTGRALLEQLHAAPWLQAAASTDRLDVEQLDYA